MESRLNISGYNMWVGKLKDRDYRAAVQELIDFLKDKVPECADEDFVSRFLNGASNLFFSTRSQEYRACIDVVPSKEESTPEHWILTITRAGEFELAHIDYKHFAS